jgi:hypothetical protein
MAAPSEEKLICENRKPWLAKMRKDRKRDFKKSERLKEGQPSNNNFEYPQNVR